MNRLRDLLRSDDVDPEARNRFLLTTGIILVVAFALGLIAVGYYVDRIAPRNDTVFTVGDRKFSYAYLEDRVDAANAEGRFVTSDIVFGIARIVADIQNEELVRLIAAEEGVTATQEEIEQQMREDVGASPEAERNVFAARLRDRLQTLGLSLDRYEEMMEAELLEQKLTDRITESLPAEMEQVDASIIQVETDAQAVLARERLAAGDAFEDVAKELSRHSSASDGGALGWAPKELFIPALADQVFELEPGTTSDVIETEDGFYIVRVHGKETRELDEPTRLRLARTRFNERLEEASNQYELQNLVTIEQAQRIASRLGSRG